MSQQASKSSKMQVESTSYLARIKQAASSMESRIQKTRLEPLVRTRYHAAGVLAVTAAILLTVFPVWRWNIMLSLYMPMMSNLHFTAPVLFEALWNAYLAADLASLPEESVITDCPVIEAKDYSWAKFAEISQDLSQPVILRGLFADSTAVKSFGTDEWLQKHGNFTLQTIIDKRKTYQYDYDFEEVQFEDYVADIKKGEFRYSYGLDELYHKYPELVEDLEIERFGWTQRPMFCRSLALFLSSGGPGLKWHNADSANFGMQIQGSKTFYLIDPKYSMFMGPQGNADPYATGFSCRSPKSVIDRVPRIRAHVKAGDVIFTPVWWWHSVETFADKKTKLNALNTCRFSDTWRAFKINPTLELYRHTGFVNWIHPSLPIAVRWLPYFRVLQDGIRQLFDLMPDWNSEDCFSSKRAACERYFQSIGYETGKANY